MIYYAATENESTEQHMIISGHSLGTVIFPLNYTASALQGLICQCPYQTWDFLMSGAELVISEQSPDTPLSESVKLTPGKIMKLMQKIVTWMQLCPQPAPLSLHKVWGPGNQ